MKNNIKKFYNEHKDAVHILGIVSATAATVAFVSYQAGKMNCNVKMVQTDDLENITAIFVTLTNGRVRYFQPPTV